MSSRPAGYALAQPPAERSAFLLLALLILLKHRIRWNILTVRHVLMAKEGSMKFSAAVFACVVLIAINGQPSPAQEHDKDSTGLTISKQPTAKEIGLPIYPGSKPHKDETNDSGANFGLWGGGSGFKLAVMKMETADAPDKVAVFYKKALS